MRQNVKGVSPLSNEARTAYTIERITDALLKLMKDYKTSFDKHKLHFYQKRSCSRCSYQALLLLDSAHNAEVVFTAHGDMGFYHF